jgi:hypothetical protein
MNKHSLKTTSLSTFLLPRKKRKFPQEDPKKILEIIENGAVIIPELKEHPQYSFFSHDSPLKNQHLNKSITTLRFNLLNKTSNILITFEFSSSKNKNGNQDVFLMFPGPTKNTDLIMNTFSKRKIAAFSCYENWYDSDAKGISTCSFWFSDGAIGIWASISKSPIEDPNGNLIYSPLISRDFLLVEDLVIKMLDRMTVLGLTSRPKESAPEWAKRQVADRIARLKP